MNTDTILVTNPNNIPQQYVDKRISQKSTMLIRSNYTWQGNTSHSTIQYGKKVSFTTTEKTMYGDYKVASKNAEQVTLKVRYRINTLTTVDGKSGKMQTKILSGNIVVNKTTLSLDDKLEMLISY